MSHKAQIRAKCRTGPNSPSSAGLAPARMRHPKSGSNLNVNYKRGMGGDLKTYQILEYYSYVLHLVFMNSQGG